MLEHQRKKTQELLLKKQQSNKDVQHAGSPTRSSVFVSSPDIQGRNKPARNQRAQSKSLVKLSESSSARAGDKEEPKGGVSVFTSGRALDSNELFVDPGLSQF